MTDKGRTEATWRGEPEPDLPGPQGFAGWFRVVRRGVPAILVLIVGVILILPMRLIERLFTARAGHGPARMCRSSAALSCCALASAGAGLASPCRGPARLWPIIPAGWISLC